MASRKDEKEARRAERVAAEQAEHSKHARQQRLLIGGGVLGGGAALVVIVLLLLSGGGDKAGGGTETPNTSVPIPARQITDLDAAAKKAGCVVRTFPSEGREHLASNTAVNNNYKTNPPTSGNHRPIPAEDGVYATGNEPDKENWVHTLEHGRIEYQYAPGTAQKRIDQLQTLFAEPFKGASGYHQLVFQNNTNMPFAVAGVAWTHYVGCKKFTDATFDALRAFRDRFVDKGPELIP
jgi:hypothetical protein